MSDADSRLNDAADRAEAGADIIEQVANGGDTVEVPTASGPRPSLAKWFADRYAEFYAWAALILSDCLEVLGLAQAVLADTVAAKVAAESAQALAESARDSALLNVNAYPSTAAGLAETLEGTQFLVITEEWFFRYSHDSGPTATLLGSYPTAAYINQPFIQLNTNLIRTQTEIVECCAFS